MSLNELWTAASGSEFSPLVTKNNLLPVAFVFLLSALFLTGGFGLNRSFATLATLGSAGALAFGFGVVYLICAVGVYV